MIAARRCQRGHPEFEQAKGGTIRRARVHAEGSFSMNVRSRGARDFQEEEENNSDSDYPIS